MYWKYAFSAFGITPYSWAGPVSGNVPPIVTVLAVTPGVFAVAASADAAITAPTRTTRAIPRLSLVLLVIWPPDCGGLRNHDCFGSDLVVQLRRGAPGPSRAGPAPSPGSRSPRRAPGHLRPRSRASS